MTKLKKVHMSEYGCNYCRYYCDKWTCSLNQCFLIAEAQQKKKEAELITAPQQTIKWEVIA